MFNAIQKLRPILCKEAQKKPKVPFSAFFWRRFKGSDFRDFQSLRGGKKSSQTDVLILFVTKPQLLTKLSRQWSREANC